MALVPANEMARVRDGLKRFSGGFTPGQKAVTAAAMAAVLVGAAIFMSLSGRPSYAPLFTNLQPSDAANVTSNLTSNKIPYQLADGGTTVMVPANDVDQERIALAQAGLPASSTVGLSLLDKTGITSSDIQQQADYLQALQGELEQTIDAIHGVSSSQVNIALPANQTFSLTESGPTGASVLVDMEAGQSLTDSEVQAIVHLVGSSVPNLDANTVTVADSDGDLLAGPGVGAGVGGTDSQTTDYDASVQSKVETYLDAVLGQNNADVQVNATLDYDQVQTTTQSILPGANGQPTNFCTSTNQSSSNFSGSGTPPGGAAGTTDVVASGSGNSTYTQTQNSQTCETNQQTQTVDQAPGTVKTESVAVLVNAKAVPRSTSLSALRAGVAAAAGIDSARGDQLAFSAMPFSSAGAQEAAKAEAAAKTATASQSMMGLIRAAVVVLVIFAALFLLWRSSKQARAESSSSVIAPEAMAALQMQRLAAEQHTSQLPATPMVAVPQSTETADVNRFIDSQPDEVATMLRTWITDPRGAGVR
ncbi:MAG TPA: flagellar basal-body MS-ring/collar protein FliF [Acidimicrobiales bacterium]|nr:flagellar basal-body MS-ring/collar protein FliF [Acidimicrobiales bacterium]